MGATAAAVAAAVEIPLTWIAALSARGQAVPAAVADREAQAVRVVFCCTIPRPRRSGPGASWYRTDGPFYP